MLIDTHAHYDDAAFDEDREQLLEELRQKGITVIDAGASFASTLRAADLAEKHEHIYALAGIHPEELEEISEEQMAAILSISRGPKVVGIGEIGLDYHREGADPQLQKRWFQRQLALAKEAELPVCIHSRDAAQDTFEILKENARGWFGGVMHCYSYSREMAEEYLKMGMLFGIGGVLTFKNAKKLKETVAMLPMEAIVLETDCPYLAPTPHRGERNSSLYLPAVAAEIAAIKEISEEEVLRITAENAYRLYPKLHG